jgi:hypothetical protein
LYIVWRETPAAAAMSLIVARRTPYWLMTAYPAAAILQALSSMQVISTSNAKMSIYSCTENVKTRQ